MDLVAASTYGAWIVSPKALKASAGTRSTSRRASTRGRARTPSPTTRPGDEVVLKKYDEYWNDEAAGTYETIDISITPDAVTAQQMLTSGEVDYATSVPAGEPRAARVDRRLRDPGLQLAVQLRRALQHHCARRWTTRRSARRSPTRCRTTTSSRWVPRATARRATGRCRRASSRTPRTCRCTSRTSTRPQQLLAESRPRGRVQPDPDLRLGEPRRGAVRPADQGRVREDRCRGRRPRPALQPAVGEGQGRPGERAGHLRRLLLADLQRRRRGQPLLAVPLQRRAVLQPQLLEERSSTTQLVDEAGTAHRQRPGRGPGEVRGSHGHPVRRGARRVPVRRPRHQRGTEGPLGRDRTTRTTRSRCSSPPSSPPDPVGHLVPPRPGAPPTPRKLSACSAS